MELDRAAYAERFADWLVRIEQMHTGARHLANAETAFAPLPKPLAEARVGLLTSAGAYVEGDEAFDVDDPHGDPGFRTIPDDVPLDRIRFAALALRHGARGGRPERRPPDRAAARARRRRRRRRCSGRARRHDGLQSRPDARGRGVGARGRGSTSRRRRSTSSSSVRVDRCATSRSGWSRERSSGRGRNGLADAAPDITAHMNVSRAAYVRFPLGNPFGEAKRPDHQRRILRTCSRLVEEAERPTLLDAPLPLAAHVSAYEPVKKQADELERLFYEALSAADAYHALLERLAAEEEAKPEPNAEARPPLPPPAAGGRRAARLDGGRPARGAAADHRPHPDDQADRGGALRLGARAAPSSRARRAAATAAARPASPPRSPIASSISSAALTPTW